MDQQERNIIEDLFGKLRQAEAQSGPRDPEAEALIRDLVNRQPAAPYLMAQAIVVQEQALANAQQRIQELEEQARQAPAQPASGGIFGNLFGGPSQPAPRPTQRAASPRPQAGRASPWGRAGSGSGAPGPMQRSPAFGQHQPARQGGGFMAGAMQTAVGVAGGVLLGNAIAGMFAGDASAADVADAGPADLPLEDASFDDPGMDMDSGFDMGGDFGDL